MVMARSWFLPLAICFTQHRIDGSHCHLLGFYRLYYLPGRIPNTRLKNGLQTFTATCRKENAIVFRCVVVPPKSRFSATQTFTFTLNNATLHVWGIPFIKSHLSPSSLNFRISLLFPLFRLTGCLCSVLWIFTQPLTSLTTN